MRILGVASALTWAAPVFASCDTPFMKCTFQGGAKAVEICLSGSDVSYTFGRVGNAAELALSVPVVDVDYLPWPGVGSSIWETVTFYNDGYSYEVLVGFERNPENPAHFGGITITKAGQELATLSCDPGSIDWGWGTDLFDAKAAAGLCWDYGRDADWKPC
ncbi:MAG: hypothetical protein AAFQ64_19320 [Pseudomonadota bacterium]